jgi:hypothetical protein
MECGFLCRFVSHFGVAAPQCHTGKLSQSIVASGVVRVFLLVLVATISFSVKSERRTKHKVCSFRLVVLLWMWFAFLTLNWTLCVQMSRQLSAGRNNGRRKNGQGEFKSSVGAVATEVVPFSGLARCGCKLCVDKKTGVPICTTHVDLNHFRPNSPCIGIASFIKHCSGAQIDCEREVEMLQNFPRLFPEGHEPVLKVVSQDAHLAMNVDCALIKSQDDEWTPNTPFHSDNAEHNGKCFWDIHGLDMDPEEKCEVLKVTQEQKLRTERWKKGTAHLTQEQLAERCATSKMAVQKMVSVPFKAKLEVAKHKKEEEEKKPASVSKKRMIESVLNSPIVAATDEEVRAMVQQEIGGPGGRTGGAEAVAAAAAAANEGPFDTGTNSNDNNGAGRGGGRGSVGTRSSSNGRGGNGSGRGRGRGRGRGGGGRRSSSL